MPLLSFGRSRTCSLMFMFCTRLHFRPFRELSAPFFQIFWRLHMFMLFRPEHPRVLLVFSFLPPIFLVPPAHCGKSFQTGGNGKRGRLGQLFFCRGVVEGRAESGGVPPAPPFFLLFRLRRAFFVPVSFLLRLSFFLVLKREKRGEGGREAEKDNQTTNTKQNQNQKQKETKRKSTTKPTWPRFEI